MFNVVGKFFFNINARHSSNMSVRNRKKIKGEKKGWAFVHTFTAEVHINCTDTGLISLHHHTSV